MAEAAVRPDGVEAIDPTGVSADDLAVLEAIQRRVLWLSTSIVHHANHVRANLDGLKVGGHQASSASVVSILTALYFGDLLRAGDRVAIKPHASPAYHAVQYLLGHLPRQYLTTLREFTACRPTPAVPRTPIRSISRRLGRPGRGGAAVRRAGAPLRAGPLRPRPPPRRFIAVLGDAELDEGNVWEAIRGARPAALGNVLWIVDCRNNQRLPGVSRPPLIGASRSRFHWWGPGRARHGQTPNRHPTPTES